MTREQLRQYLERRGLTRTETARRFDIDVRTVRRWISGDAPCR